MAGVRGNKAYGQTGIVLLLLKIDVALSNMEHLHGVWKIAVIQKLFLLYMRYLYIKIECLKCSVETKFLFK